MWRRFGTHTRTHDLSSRIPLAPADGTKTIVCGNPSWQADLASGSKVVIGYTGSKPQLPVNPFNGGFFLDFLAAYTIESAWDSGA